MLKTAFQPWGFASGHVAPMLFHVFLKRITIINITFFQRLITMYFLKPHMMTKTCCTIYRVKGYRNPPPSVGKVMEEVTSEMNVKTILRWNCGQD